MARTTCTSRERAVPNQRPCSENPFCASLSPELRAQLCKSCIKTTFAPKSSIEFNYNNVLIILDGLCWIDGMGKPIDLTYRGELVFYPAFDGDALFRVRAGHLDDDLTRNALSTGRLVTLSNVSCAVIQETVFRDLTANNLEFSRALNDSLLEMMEHIVIFNLCVYRSEAREAVRFVVSYARNMGIDYLTHEQIAHLTGLGRSTVTNALHELALESS